MTERCADCRFFVESVGETGVCRRFPPTPLIAPATLGQACDVYSSFPPMKPEGWCGEFKPKRSDMQ